MLARRQFALAIVTLLCMQAPSFAQQVFWQSDVEAAKRLAAQTNRLVLIHFSAPWCQPCARLEENVFNKPGFSASLEPNYVGVKLNLDEHKKLASQYSVDRIPADVIITPQGQVVQKLQSPPTIENYLGTMQQVAARARAPAAIAANTAQPPAGNGSLPVAPPIVPPGSQASNPQPPASSSAGQPIKMSDDRYADYFSNLRASQQPAGNTQMPAAQMPASAPSAMTAQQAPPSTNLASAPADVQARYATSTTTQPPPAMPNTPVAMASDGARAPVAGARGILPHATWSPPASQQPPAQASASPPAASVAAAPPARTRQLPPGSPPLGLDGYCPVSLVEKQSWKDGDDRFGAIHHGRTYLFVGQAEQQRFLANPDAFSPVMSGDDPVLALDENKSVPGNRKHGVFCGNRVYLFSCEATLNAFSKNPGRYAPEITQARR